jgi:signal transduction histidine kinase
MRGISTDFKENLTVAMKESLPLSELKEAGKTLTDTIAASNQASAELRNNIKVAGLTRIGVIAAATLVVIVASWLVTHFHYESRFEKARLSVVSRVIEQVEDNQAILNELAKANRRLELSRSESGTKLLAISNAKGYTSTSKAGVIKFK